MRVTILVGALLTLLVGWLGRSEPARPAGAAGSIGLVSAPRGDLPAGFDPDFRERIHRDFSDFVRRRLGHPLSVAQAAKAMAVQDAFWRDHGRSVIALQRRRVGPREFGVRTHEETLRFSQGMERVFSDEDYEKIFDVPKGTDVYPLLYHSSQEQPGVTLEAGGGVPRS